MNFLITGGSSGLGEALAVELGRRGHAVGLVARRDDLLAEVARKVEAAGGRAAFAAADVLDLDALKEAVGRIEAVLGPTDVVIANAGGGIPNSATKLDPEVVKQVMRLNFDGVVHTFAAVLPAMVERRSGHIAAVSSVAGFVGLPPSGPYSAAKAAVSTLLQAYAIELADHGVAVTTIHPGYVRTPLVAKNRFPMPFIIDADHAARIMADGLLKRRRQINYPWRMNLLMQTLRLLPGFVFEPLYRRVALGRARG